MDWVQAVVLGVIQGLTEFLPISSSAHLVLVPWIFRWQYQGLAYDVALHWGTLAALGIYFWRDWNRLIQGGLRDPKGPEGKILFGLAAASIPAAVFGLIWEERAEHIFRTPERMAFNLIVFGVLLWVAERFGRRKRDLSSLTIQDMFAIGAAQALALMPGVSRSGVTITAALALGLNREAAVHFSFLLGFPIILGAGMLKLKDIGTEQLNGPFFAGIAAAALTGMAAIRLLSYYAKSRDFSIFIAYRILLGVLLILLGAMSPEGTKAKLMDKNLKRPEVEMNDSTEGRLARHVAMLAGTIGERNPYYHKALERTRDYVIHEFRKAGYTPELQEYRVRNLPLIEDGAVFQNVIAELSGRRPASEGVYVVGAHYDSAPGTPGADDNASGVAALLELAALLKGFAPEFSIRFVAFSTEEPPSFSTENMGSRHYARLMKNRGEKVLGMISLEMLGFYSDHPGSQLYPPLLSWFYPDKGDFVGLTTVLSSRKWLSRCVKIWKKQPGAFPIEHAALPSFIAAVTLSDHWSFIQEGFPALMITDTAFFRNPHYHEETDTPDKLDYRRMAALTQTLAGTLKDLSRLAP